MAEAETGVMGDRVTEVAEKKVPWAAKRRHGTLPGSTQCPTSHPGAPPAARASRQSALWMTRDAPPSQEEATAAKVEVAEAEVDGTRTKDGAGRAGISPGTNLGPTQGVIFRRNSYPGHHGPIFRRGGMTPTLHPQRPKNGPGVNNYYLAS